MDIRVSDNGRTLYVILRYVPNMVMCLFSAPWRCFLSAEFSVILHRILKNVLICWPRWKSAFRSSRWPDVLDASVEKFVEDNKIIKMHSDSTQKLQTLIQSNLKLITWVFNIHQKKINQETPLLNENIKQHKSDRPMKGIQINQNVLAYKQQ